MIHLFSNRGYDIAYSPATGDFYQVDAEHLKTIRSMLSPESSLRAPETEIEREVFELFPAYLESPHGNDVGLIEESLQGSLLQRLTFVVTDRCNLRCRYCYEGSESNVRMNGRTRSLDSSVAAVALDVAEEVYGGVKAIVFFGGEPLMNMKSIASIVLEIEKRRSNRPGFYGTYGIITNGTLIDDSKAEFLKRFQFRVTISSDGPQEINDRWRIDRRGNGASLRAERGIRILKEHGVPVQIQATLTPMHVENGWTPVELSRFFKTMGTEAPHIVHAQLADDSDVPWREADIQKLITSYVSSIDHDLGCIERGDFENVYVFSRFIGFLSALVGKKRAPLRCPAGTELTVTADGFFTPCFMFAQDERFNLVGVSRRASRELRRGLALFLSQNAKAQNGECGKCWARDLCNGCMGANVYLSDGDLQGNDGINCRIVKACVEELMGAFTSMQLEAGRWERFLDNYRQLMALNSANENC